MASTIACTFSGGKKEKYSKSPLALLKGHHFTFLIFLIEQKTIGLPRMKERTRENEKISGSDSFSTVRTGYVFRLHQCCI